MRLIVAGLVAFLTLTPAARADHTPVPSSVTLAGSLQSELGCPNDWAPECAQTHLQPVGGGVFRATFDLPAGDYAYKAALNGSWTENYGAGGAPGGGDIPLSAPGGPVTFTYDHATHVISDNVPKKPGAEQGAHWLRRGVIAWDVPEGAASYRLHVAPRGGLELVDGAIAGRSYPLEPGELRPALAAKYPHLASYTGLDVPEAAQRRVRELLTGQLVVAAYGQDGRVMAATGVQLPGVLDQLYANDRELGPTWRGGRPRLAVWAPTAKHVSLLLGERRVAMRRQRDGTWTAKGRRGWRDAEYAYRVKVYAPRADAVVTNDVTDPYSLALTLNSRRSVLVDLGDPALAPPGWRSLRKPALAQPEDSTIYELHVRDFSIGDETVPAAHRGTYLAFTDAGSDGMKHLRDLARHGLNTLHLLPPTTSPRSRRTARSRRSRTATCARSGPRRNSSRRASRPWRARTASTGATTRCTTRRPRAPTRAGPAAAHARASTGRWSRASTAPACAW